MPITNITNQGDFIINAKANVLTKPILFGKAPSSNLQDVALTGESYESGSGSKKIIYNKNETKIVILKQSEDTKLPLSGVSFDLLDKDSKQIKTDLKTNESGEIIIENLNPGTYYIKEIKTLEGYILYDKVIKLDVGLNETSKIVINNYKQEEKKIELETKSSIQEISNKSTKTEITLPKTGK